MTIGPEGPLTGIGLTIGQHIDPAVRESLVMVIDDNPANVTLLERTLHHAGFSNVAGYTDPEGAIAACEASLPDLVLVDLHMPVLDGVAVIDSLNQIAPDDRYLPVVVLTADVTYEARKRALSAGANDFLTKPFDHFEVALRVANLLETRALHARLEHHARSLQAELDRRAAAEREAAAHRQRLRDRIEGVLADPTALTVAYQPIVDVATGAVVGVEALARFAVAPARPPNEWFAEAHAIGYGVDLEIAAVTRALDGMRDVPTGAFLSVNVSPTALCSDELLALVAGASADRIVVELTEHERVEDYEPVLAVIERLHGHGARIAVDDAGAGYAGLHHMLRLRPDILKLDAALTQTIDRDPVRRSLAAALVAFANEVGATLLAEGIETTGELEVLQRLGVPWGQGYLLARPGSLPLRDQQAVT